MPSLLKFSKKMPVVARRVTSNLAKKKKRIALSVHEAVAEGTPVDKGVARSNWQVEIGHSSNTFLPAYSPGRHLGRGEKSNLAGAKTQARIALAKPVSPGLPIHITNNTPYIRLLNDKGTSAQSASFFVQTAIMKALATTKGIRVLRK